MATAFDRPPPPTFEDPSARARDVQRATVELSQRTLWLFLGAEIAVSVDAVLALAVVRLITERQVEGARGSVDGPSAPARPDVG